MTFRKVSPKDYIDFETLSKASKVLDLDDKAVIKYEMMREYEATTQTVEEVSRKYGYSRNNYYKFRKRLLEEKCLRALEDRPYGRKTASKLTSEVIDWIVEIRKETKMSIHEIPSELKRRHNIELSYGAVYRALKKRAFQDSGRGGSRKKGRKKERG